MFIAQVLVGPSKQLKQIIQTEHNIVKNPNWPEANQLAIYKRGRGFELGACESDSLTTRPRCLSVELRSILNVIGQLHFRKLNSNGYTFLFLLVYFFSQVLARMTRTAASDHMRCKICVTSMDSFSSRVKL